MSRAAPNESRITGTVVAIDRQADVLTWSVRVGAADDVGALANFARRHVGREVDIEVPPGNGARVAKGDTITARVTYEGGAGGGSFLLLALD